MTTYYVAPAASGGSDSNNGLGPDASHASNKPFATIGKLIAASGVMVSGDTAYLAPGTYREVVTVAVTSPVAETQILGDPANAQGFKDGSGNLVAPGDVIWTAYTTNDTTTPSTSPLLTLNGRDFLTFKNILFIGANNAISCVSATTTNSISIVFRDCSFIPAGLSASIIEYVGLADIASNWIFDRCRFFGSVGGGQMIKITLPTSSVADYDTGFLIQNSSFIVGSGHNGVYVDASGANSFKGGGVDIFNCFCLGRMLTTGSSNLSTSIPSTCYNSVLISAGSSALAATTSGQILEDNNRISAASARTNVSAGSNSKSDMSHALLMEIGHELVTGRQLKPFGMPMASSPLLGRGATAGGPTVDILNRARPSGGASTSYAWGAFERHDTAVRETSVVDTGSNAIKITGPGDHDLFIPVDASLTTITIRVRYDTNHATTNKPQAVILNGEEVGVATETKTATGDVDTWETISFTPFTPTAKGFITLRLISRSAAGNGIAYFDTVTGASTSTQGLDYFRRGEVIPVAASIGTQNLDYFRRGEPLQVVIATAAGSGGGGPLIGGRLKR